MSKNTKSTGQNRCIACNVSFKEVNRAMHGRCAKCDTSSAGTWFLSYLCELGYIEADDDIMDGYMYGEYKRDFLNIKLKRGTQIFCQVDKENKTLFHMKYQTQKFTDDDEDVYGVWWDHPSVKSIDFTADIGFNVV